MSRVQISSPRSAVLTDMFCGFSQSLKSDARIVPSIRPRSLPCNSSFAYPFSRRCTVVVLSGKSSLSKLQINTSVSRPALRLTQPPAQCVPGVLYPGVKRGRSLRLTTHPHLVPRSRMSRSYTSSPQSAFMECNGTAPSSLL
jgi:hypothetical protein